MTVELRYPDIVKRVMEKVAECLLAYNSAVSEDVYLARIRECIRKSI